MNGKSAGSRPPRGELRVAPDPAAEAPAGEAIGKFLRTIRNEFAFVIDYPTAVRPFYHMRHPEDDTGIERT